MAHVLEEASTGRAGCRGCKQKIAKGELRFGQRMPNPYGEGDATFWFHPRCAAEKVPDDFLEFLGSGEGELPERDDLQALAEETQAHPRLARLTTVERASSGRAKCRQCHELIAKGAFRSSISEIAEGSQQPLGFVHARCAAEYCNTPLARARLRAKAAGLGDEDRAELDTELQA